MKKVRLDKLLSNRGYATRSTVDKLLDRIKVDGLTPKRSDEKVLPESVTFDGEPLDPETLLILMNKPAGYTCSHEDRPPLVYELLPPRWLQRNPALSTVGRLDRDTTGALLFTDDGQLLHRLTSPKNKLPKVYEVFLQEPLEQEDLLTGGVIELDGKPILPAKFEKLGEKHCLLELVEGRNHQVKRMFSAVGNEVVRLHRRSFCGLVADHLEPGQFELLSGIGIP